MNAKPVLLLSVALCGGCAGSQLPASIVDKTAVGLEIAQCVQTAINHEAIRQAAIQPPEAPPEPEPPTPQPAPPEPAPEPSVPDAGAS